MTPSAILVLAVVDSINPSALLVTIYLLTQRARWTLAVVYLATVSLVYLSIGFMLMFGIDSFWQAGSEWLESDIAYAAQALVGGALLGYAVLAPSPAAESDASRPEPRSMRPIAMVLLGATVTIMELPTALPYFAAIGIMTTAELPFAEWTIYLVIYNLIFILPPVALFLAGTLARSYIERRLSWLEQRLQGYARETLLWVVGIVGFFLLADALVYFEVFD